MKRFILLFAALMLSIMLSAQTQQGYVKTKGRLSKDGKVIPGQGLKGATVSIKGRTAVLVNADDGAFSFPVPEAQFLIDSVRKKGYQLVDMDALSKTYKHSANPIYLVMETPTKQMEDQMEDFNRINASQQIMISQLRAEVKQLKAQNKIDEEEYCRRLSKIAEMQSESQKLVSEMAERYSKMDFDQIDEFNRRISEYILNGELTKADSMLCTKGNIHERIDKLNQQHNANVQVRINLENSESLEQKEREDIANDCYRKFEICKMQYINDSASYYLELRTELDTMNVDWKLEAGDFIREYLADYSKSLEYYQRSLEISQTLYGEMNEKTATSYDNIGFVFGLLDDYFQAMDYHKKALKIREFVFDSIHPDIAASYCNIGYTYEKIGDYTTALNLYNKALEIQTLAAGQNNIAAAIIINNIGGSYFYMSDFNNALKYFSAALEIRKKLYPDLNNPEIATSLNNIGFVYLYQGEHSLALEYFENALRIFTDVFGEEHPNTASIINNMGGIYNLIGENDKALACFEKSLTIQKNIFGETHQNIARCYNNIAGVYDDLGEYENVISNYEMALNIDTTIFGNYHSEVSTIYNNIGVAYRDQENYSDALEYLNRALAINREIYDENNISNADVYSNIGIVYYRKGELNTALEFFQKALTIRTIILGKDNAMTIRTQEIISEIQSKLKEQENEQKNEE